MNAPSITVRGVRVFAEAFLGSFFILFALVHFEFTHSVLIPLDAVLLAPGRFLLAHVPVRSPDHLPSEILFNLLFASALCYGVLALVVWVLVRRARRDV